ncbi:MAG: HAD hydrolase family protein, partial [Pirellulales bacterium]|nr:HAD hydrolase family protein [Pirellulales bacterium]
LAAFDELEPQPDEFQAPWKRSYYAEALSFDRLDEIHRRLISAGQAVEVVYSSSRDLDVLPAGVSKGTAAARLASHWGVNSWDVCVAGDTGNDASMFAQGFCGIVVANAQPELKRILAPTIHQSARSFAAGVQEGLEFWLGAQAVHGSASR